MAKEAGLVVENDGSHLIVRDVAGTQITQIPHRLNNGFTGKKIAKEIISYAGF